MNKKAQVWSFDLIVAFFIFLITLVAIYFFSINYGSGELDEINELTFDAHIASELLLSEDNFSIVTNGKINKTKLDYFDSLSDYEKKAILGVNNNFYFNYTNLTVGGMKKDYVGIINSTPTLNQINVNRIVISDNQIKVFEVIAWS